MPDLHFTATQQSDIDSFLFCLFLLFFSLVETLPNMALNKPTAQSSIWPSLRPGLWMASNPVSGCRSGLDKCCSCTFIQSNPWWGVDLLAVHKVTAVTIVNRKQCCPERLLGTQILIRKSMSYNNIENPRCGTISTTRIFKCVSSDLASEQQHNYTLKSCHLHFREIVPKSHDVSLPPSVVVLSHQWREHQYSHSSVQAWKVATSL